MTTADPCAIATADAPGVEFSEWSRELNTIMSAEAAHELLGAPVLGTSAAPGEGKPTVSANLAASLALAGATGEG